MVVEEEAVPEDITLPRTRERITEIRPMCLVHTRDTVTRARTGRRRVTHGPGDPSPEDIRIQAIRPEAVSREGEKYFYYEKI